MPDLKIVHIIDSVERGGAETLLLNTIEAINKTHPDCRQYLVTLYRGGELLARLPAEISHFNLGMTKFNFPFVILKLRSLLKKLQIDVVHSHLLHATLVSRIALPSGTKLVSTYHSVFYDPTLVDYAKKELLLDRLTYKSEFHSIFVSEAVKKNISEAVGIKENQLVLVNFAAASFTPSYTFNQENHLRIIMVGNLNPVKNHALAISALSTLKKLNITLDIYGEGILRPELEAQIKAANAKVALKGARAMSSEILKEYDLFMMTSHHEGMPISLLEAMQTGVPALLNDLPMLRETAGESAIYFDYDSENSLIEKLTEIINNKSVLKNLSEKAVIRSQQFSAETYISNLMSIYRQK